MTQLIVWETLGALMVHCRERLGTGDLQRKYAKQGADPEMTARFMVALYGCKAWHCGERPAFEIQKLCLGSREDFWLQLHSYLKSNGTPTDG